jgi:hypothetical protein
VRVRGPVLPASKVRNVGLRRGWLWWEDGGDLAELGDLVLPMFGVVLMAMSSELQGDGGGGGGDGAPAAAWLAIHCSALTC